jgi:hypothetical protein
MIFSNDGRVNFEDLRDYEFLRKCEDLFRAYCGENEALKGKLFKNFLKSFEEESLNE